MTLAACLECSGQVSTAARHCPHCGHPVNPRTAWQAFLIFAVALTSMLLTMWLIVSLFT